MKRIEVIRSLPGNFYEFVEEIAGGLAGLYGPAAGAAYMEFGPAGVAASLAHPQVTGCALNGPSGAEAMLMGIVRNDLAHISFVHVLKRCEGQGAESQLIEWAVPHFRQSGVSGIVCETVPLCVLDVDDVYARFGFVCIDRLIMAAALTSKALCTETLRTSTPLSETEWEEASDVVLEAYEGHPGRLLHAEVRSREGAMAFIASAVSGGFGRTRPAFIRGIRRGGRLAGVVFGCEAAPEVGFILQVAVVPEFQGRGLGRTLLCEAAHCFREAGCKRLALGVTVDNPARRLYERLGFRPHRPVAAYAWWR